MDSIPSQTALLNFENSGLNDRVVRQAGCVERQDGFVLAVLGIVTKLEGGATCIDRSTDSVGGRRCQNPAIVGAYRLEGCCGCRNGCEGPVSGRITIGISYGRGVVQVVNRADMPVVGSA